MEPPGAKLPVNSGIADLAQVSLSCECNTSCSRQCNVLPACLRHHPVIHNEGLKICSAQRKLHADKAAQAVEGCQTKRASLHC